MKFMKDDGYFVSINGLNKTSFTNYTVIDNVMEDYLKENNIELIQDEAIVYDAEVNGDSIHNILDKNVKIKDIDLRDFDIPYQVVIVRVYRKKPSTSAS